MGLTQVLEFCGERGPFLCCQLLNPRNPCGLEQSQIPHANPTEFTEVTRLMQLAQPL